MHSLGIPRLHNVRRIIECIPEKVRNFILYDSNESMFSAVWKSLYQSTKEWACPEGSCRNKLLIRIETDLDPRNFIPHSSLAHRP